MCLWLYMCMWVTKPLKERSIQNSYNKYHGRTNMAAITIHVYIESSWCECMSTSAVAKRIKKKNAEWSICIHNRSCWYTITDAFRMTTHSYSCMNEYARANTIEHISNSGITISKWVYACVYMWVWCTTHNQRCQLSEANINEKKNWASVRTYEAAAAG